MPRIRGTSNANRVQPTLIVRNEEVGLDGGEVAYVPAERAVIAFRGGSWPRLIRIDGRPVRVPPGDPALIMLDLTESTGFHMLEVEGDTYCFASEDTKLRLGGIEEMLREMRGAGTGWGGQLMFSDGTGLRDPHVVFGWLDEWADQTLTRVAQVLSAPIVSHVAETYLSRRAERHVLPHRTLRLIRSNPRGYLTTSPAGPLLVNGRRYLPSRFVLRRYRASIETPAHRRMVALLRHIERLSKEVLTVESDAMTRARCRAWLATAEECLLQPLCQRVSASHAPIPPLVRESEELTDRRYRQLFDCYADFCHGFGWLAQSMFLPRYSYVARANQIYQAYVASCSAAQLGLVPAALILGSAQPAFSDTDLELYYDCEPPMEVLRSWRLVSNLPDHSRPDLVLRMPSTGNVAVMDAKYRVGPDGGATEDSRRDVSSYLDLYGLKTITIVFPGKDSAYREVAGHDKVIYEIPLSPGYSPALLQERIARVVASLVAPTY